MLMQDKNNRRDRRGHPAMVGRQGPGRMIRPFAKPVDLADVGLTDAGLEGQFLLRRNMDFRRG
jgi:hypothetical protein